MAKDEQISIRLEKDVADRAEKLAQIMASRPEYKAFRMTRAAVLRMAMIEGIAALESRFSVSRKGR